MEEIQPGRVKSLPADQASVRIIEVIPDQRAAQIAHMNPDLVGTSGFKPQLHKSKFFVLLQSLKVGDGRFPVQEIHLAFKEGAGNSADRCIDRAAFRRDPLYDGQVGSADLAVFHHLREDRAAQSIFCDDKKAGGIPVQTVDTAVDKGIFQLAIMKKYTIGKGVFPVSHGGMDRSVRRFIYYEKILIFPDNGEGNRGGENRGVSGVFHRRICRWSPSFRCTFVKAGD